MRFKHFLFFKVPVLRSTSTREVRARLEVLPYEGGDQVAEGPLEASPKESYSVDLHVPKELHAVPASLPTPCAKDVVSDCSKTVQVIYTFFFFETMYDSLDCPGTSSVD